MARSVGCITTVLAVSLLAQQAPRASAAGAAGKALAAGAPLQARNQRIFLFVFGRGRLQAPDRGIDSAIRFVRERLLPQDRVAVLAYNRATDFTTDRGSILATLERFEKKHDYIEALLKQQLSGLGAIYGSKTPNKVAPLV